MSQTLKPCTSLQTRVDLVGNVGVRPVCPLATRLGDGLGDAHLGDLLGRGEELHGHAPGGVDGGVAVEGPDTGVVGGVELDDEMAVGTNLGGVAAHGVVGADDGLAVPLVGTLVQDVHVETVHVHGVTGSLLVRCAAVGMSGQTYGATLAL